MPDPTTTVPEVLSAVHELHQDLLVAAALAVFLLAALVVSSWALR